MMQVQGEGTAAQGVNSKIELTQVLFFGKQPTLRWAISPSPPQDTLGLCLY